MSYSPPSLPTQNAQNVPAPTDPWERGAALATACAVFVSVLSIYLLLRPPLFNYDGYIYRLQALRPTQSDSINPHHLMWYPVLKAFARLASAVASPSPEAFQLFGILINSLSLALFCLLLVRLTNRLALPAAMTIFIAFSPRIWNLGFQNQPYPLLDLSVVVFLWTLVWCPGKHLTRLSDPLTPQPLSPKGARGELILLPSPLWGRGWLAEAFSSAEARRVRGFYPLSNLTRDTTLVASGAPSRWRWAAGGVAVFAAVMLQQAMALVVPAVAIGLVLAGAGPWKDRWKLAVRWAGGMALSVAAAYALMARVAGVKPAGFLDWTLMYLQAQHGIQVQWPQSAIKSVIGMVGTVLETSRVRNLFDPQEGGEVIWRLYGGLLVAGCAAIVFLIARRSVRERLMRLSRSNPSVAPVVMLVLAWSLFVFFWEPAGYYWSVNLFPLAFLAALWLGGSPKRTTLIVATMLLLISGWNVYWNHRQDQAYSVNYPPPLLEQIRAQLGPNDVFIVAGRDWYANLDYDLLLACLDDWPNDPALALFDEYVMRGSQEPWQKRLDRDIQAALAAGGRVYVADHIFWNESYQDSSAPPTPFQSMRAHSLPAWMARASRVRLRVSFAATSCASPNSKSPRTSSGS